MKWINTLFILSLFFASCTEKSDIETEEKTAEFKYPAIFVETFQKVDVAPSNFILDSLFISDSTLNNRKNSLTPKEVHELTKVFNAHKLTEETEYNFRDYFKITKAKENKTYSKYVENLDIGMTKDANAYSLLKLNYGDTCSVLIWKLEYASYEACPYFTGTHFFCSIFDQSKFVETLQIGMEESAGDPPMSFVASQYASISTSGLIKFSYEDFVYEEDSEVEHHKESAKFQITSKGFLNP